MPANPSPEGLPYHAILTAIVKRFARMVGFPAALNVARKVPCLAVDREANVLDYNKDDPLATITLLIDRYRTVFGEVAVALAHEATQPIVETTDDALAQEVGRLTSAMNGPIEILLVDQYTIFREGLVSLLTTQPDMKVVGKAGSLREAVARSRELKPHLVLMDTNLPDGTGVEAARAILADQPTTKVVFLTMVDDDDSLFAAVRAGAMGYMHKNVRPTELLNQLRRVAQGDAGISPAIARRILVEFSRTSAVRYADEPGNAELTSRELEIMQELARGSTNREIGRKFVISEHTVKNHVHSVLTKLRLRSRREVADYLRTHSWLLTAFPHLPE